MSPVENLLDYIDSFSPETNESSATWYPRYTHTYEEIIQEPKSASSLEKLWAASDNSVASIRQGILSGDDYENAKDALASITAQIQASPSHATYLQALAEIESLKQRGIIKKRYVALLNRVFAALHPDKVTSTVIDNAFNKVARHLNKKFDLKLSLNGDWYERNTELKRALQGRLPLDYDPIRLNVALWNIYQDLEGKHKHKGIQENSQNTYAVLASNSQPLNQILFGPPGTGKTFTTIERAVRAAEPGFTWSNRNDLKEKYQELIRKGRIRFVTFHQSFSYEDFVEGLTAHTDDEKLVYEKRLGIFRQIVRDAKEHQTTEVKNPTNSFNDCWEAFLTEFEDHPEGVQISMKRSKFIITEVDGNTIRFDKNQGDSVNTLSVSTLEAIFNGERRFNGGLKPYYQSLISHLESLGEQLDKKAVQRQN
ncbi:MAG: hypothetical protein HRU48_23240 [Vibrio sp.]|uniref:hypothetical protein n=1 Tax=Vibrio sp. TaxID=678 RepID=UPI001EB50E08|nr:hypothetical protein [Vibrio sp.]NRB70226.1 hypothetical protein [Vibrio sp.]